MARVTGDGGVRSCRFSPSGWVCFVMLCNVSFPKFARKGFFLDLLPPLTLELVTKRLRFWVELFLSSEILFWSIKKPPSLRVRERSQPCLQLKVCSLLLVTAPNVSPHMINWQSSLGSLFARCSPSTKYPSGLSWPAQRGANWNKLH